MPVEMERREKIKQKELQESKTVDFSFIGLADHAESEIKWIKLHQMFDK
tara:strand:+ start:1654 stop:1800 length:147 start_codon:yes stop_codon:yes gene_type:complete